MAKTFREVLIEAAEQARDEGSITQRELRVIRFATLFPHVLAKVQSAVATTAKEEGTLAASDMAAIDWSAILAFIKELIPLILQLIKLFQ